MAALPSFVPISNNPNLIRDTKSHAIVNRDKNALSRAKAQKETVVKLRKKTENLETEVKTLRDEFDNLKRLVMNTCSTDGK
jgi:hypothetical protein